MLQAFYRNIIVLVTLMVWAQTVHATILEEMISGMHMGDQTEFYESYMKDPDADAHMMQQMIQKLQKMDSFTRLKSYKKYMARLNADPQTVRDILEQEQNIHNKVEFGILYFKNPAADSFVCDELASWAVDLKNRFNQKRISKFYQAYLGREDADLVVCGKIIAFIQKDFRLYESYKAKICVTYLSRLTADACTIRRLIDEGVSTSWEASYQYQIYKAYFFSKHVDPAVTREKFEWTERFDQPDLNFYLAYLMAENAYVQHKDEMYIQHQDWVEEPERLKALWQDRDQVKCLEYKILRITKRCGGDAVKLMNIVKIKQMELDSSITEASVRKLDADLQLLKEALAYKQASE